jgi:hypothetical protein
LAQGRLSLLLAWKSRPLGGRPQIDTELRALIRRMSMENPLWVAPRIRGELLKLGFEVAQSSVAKYMVKRRAPPSQGWRTFLHNHAPDVAAMNLFIVPTIGFDLLCTFVIVRLDRRDQSGSTSQQIPRPNGLRVRLLTHFPGMRLRITSSAIPTGSMAASSRADCAPWASGIRRSSATTLRGANMDGRRAVQTAVDIGGLDHRFWETADNVPLVLPANVAFSCKSIN